MLSAASGVESRFPAMRSKQLKVFSSLFIFFFVASLAALERQDPGVYHARRVALSQKTTGGVVVLFAPIERADEIFGFHR